MSPYIDVPSLPDASRSEINFYDTSFFQHDASRQLPSPEFVIQHVQQVSGHQLGVAKFEHLGLVVKFSPQLMLEEAQTMRAIKSAFPQSEVPVPEVFGWRCYKNYRFIYMVRDGHALCKVTPSTRAKADKESICIELRDVISSLQKVTRNPTDAPICSINNGRLQDRFFQFDGAGGPFSSIQLFNNFFFAVAARRPPQLEGYMDGPYRDFLSDYGNVYFTHGDLTLTNIMVVGEPGSYKVKAIIDWEQAGWYPENWEYCKLLVGVHYEHEWRKTGWVNKLMRTFENEWTAYQEPIFATNTVNDSIITSTDKVVSWKRDGIRGCEELEGDDTLLVFGKGTLGDSQLSVNKVS